MTSRHSSIAIGQRVWKTQPGGGRNGDGTSPTRMMRSRVRSISGSVIGTAESSARVYGCSGFSYSSLEYSRRQRCEPYHEC